MFCEKHIRSYIQFPGQVPSKIPEISFREKPSRSLLITVFTKPEGEPWVTTKLVPLQSLEKFIQDRLSVKNIQQFRYKKEIGAN